MWYNDENTRKKNRGSAGYFLCVFGKEVKFMKKFIAFFALAAAALAIAAAPVFAADIAVRVNGRTVTFREDPKPVILNERTYVPLRRVLEFMGAKVEWNAETREVTVTSADNITMVVLTIDSTEINVYTFTSVLHADKKTVTSDVAPIIMNDRTMLPIRVIAEALGADVEYDERGIADITTVQAKSTAKRTVGKEAVEQAGSVIGAISAELPKIGIHCEAKDIKEGDPVYVYVRVSDLEKARIEDAEFAGVVTTVLYESDKFSYEGFKSISEEGEVDSTLSADNGEFYENGVKCIYIYGPGNTKPPAEDGTVLKMEFKSLTGEGGTFSISDGVSELGYDNEIIFIKDNNYYSVSKYTELYVDSTEVEVK